MSTALADGFLTTAPPGKPLTPFNSHVIQWQMKTRAQREGLPRALQPKGTELPLFPDTLSLPGSAPRTLLPTRPFPGLLPAATHLGQHPGLGGT